MSQPFQLYRLQQLDSHLDQDHARLNAIEVVLGDNHELMLAEQEAAQVASALEAARKALHRAEEDVKAQRLKIEQTESTLYGGKVRNPKELQDLQNESAALKRYLVTLEDRQIEQMITLEDVEQEHKAAAQKLEAARQLHAQTHQSLVQEQTVLLEEVKRLQVERQAALSSVPAEDLSLYTQLRQQRRGVAVAKVVDKTCSACGSTLSAALLHASRSPNQLTRCETCGRILYTG